MLAFETKVASNSRAVMNVKIDEALNFLRSDQALRSNYRKSVLGEVRIVAKEFDDRVRSEVEDKLFPSYGAEIRYAALSMCAEGLSSYGDISMIFSDTAVSKRATLLEENSYDFTRRRMNAVGAPIPLGYRAKWNDRGKLAATKVASDLSKDTEHAEFAKLLLWSTGDRTNDNFIEVHIYGTISNGALETIGGPEKSSDTIENAKLTELRDLVDNKGIRWVTR